MTLQRLRNVIRVVGLLVFALLGLLLWSMHRTLSELPKDGQAGRGPRPASLRHRTILAAGLGPDQALERLLGRGFTLHFRQDLTGFGDIPLSRTQPSTPRASRLTNGQDAL